MSHPWLVLLQAAALGAALGVCGIYPWHWRFWVVIIPNAVIIGFLP